MAFTPTQLPSGRWRGGFRHPVTRKLVRKTFDYSYEAEAWAITEEDRAQSASTGQPIDAAAPMRTASAEWLGPTLTEYGRAYLARRGDLARATRNKYTAWLRGLGIAYGEAEPIGGHHMGTLRRSTIQTWITAQVEAEVGKPTINGRLSFIRKLYADMLAEGDSPIQRDPTVRIAYLPEDLTEDYVLSRDEEAELLASAPTIHPQLAVAILTALDAGLRWQEVYALRASSVKDGPSGPASFLEVVKAVQRGSNDLKVPKGKRSRIVPTTERLSRALLPFAQEARARQGAQGLLFPAGTRPGRDAVGDRPWTWSNHSNRQWGPLLFAIGAAHEVTVDTGRIRTYATKLGPAGSPITWTRYADFRFTFHDLRHTYGSRLADQGVARHRIAALMGHADEKTTGRYIHATDDGVNLDLVRAALAS